MSKSKILRRIAMIVSLLMLITSTVNTTYGFIVTSTDPIVNIFTPEDGNVSGLVLSKTVEHPYGSEYKIPDNITFDFKIELGSYYANTKLNTTAGEMTADENGNLTVTVKPGVTLGIDGLDEGTVVKVTELATDLAGFAIKDGMATKAITVDADGSAAIEFVNTYTPANVQPSNVTVTGVKVLEGRDWQDGDTFTFKLEQKIGDSWTELGTKTITYNADNADFNQFDFSELVQALTFDAVGTYAFRITEVVGELDNMDYDETINHFAIKVTDTDMDGKLEVQDVNGAQNITVTKDDTTGTYAAHVTFNNTFVPPVIPDDIHVTVTVNKTVSNTGTEKIGPGGFEFVLEDIASGSKQALRCDENGHALFDLTFTGADIGKTFEYTLRETDEGKNGITYDEDVYHIRIAITTGEDDKLIATVTCNNSVVETCVAAFENIYHIVHEPTPPTGDRSDTTFWFVMMIISGAASILLLAIELRKRSVK